MLSATVLLVGDVQHDDMNAGHSDHQCGCGSHTPAVRSVHQTLDELDFDRGIWSAALNGEEKKVSEQLDKRVNPDVRDSAGYTALVSTKWNGKAFRQIS